MTTPKCVYNYEALRSVEPPATPDPHKLLPACDYVFVSGSLNSQDSGIQGFFEWRPNSTADDNNGTVIKPNMLPAKGRWHRVFDGAISVKWFGAIGDGTSHTLSTRYKTLIAAQADYPFISLLNDEIDWAAIQAAAKAAGLVGTGATLFFPAGIYKITNTITIPANVTISGNLASILVAFDANSTSDAIIILSGNNISVDGLTVTAADATIKNMHPWNVFVATGSSGSLLSDIRFTNVTITGFLKVAGSANVGEHISVHGIRLTYCTRVTIDNCLINGISGHAVFLDSVTYASCTNTRFIDMLWAGFHTEHDCHFIDILDCKFMSELSNARQWSASIHIMSQCQPFKLADSHITIKGCYFSGMHNYGAVVAIASAWFVDIEGNIFDRCITQSLLGDPTANNCVNIVMRGAGPFEYGSNGGTTTNGSTVVTLTPADALLWASLMPTNPSTPSSPQPPTQPVDLPPNPQITGIGIPANTSVLSVDTISNTLTMDKKATAPGTVAISATSGNIPPKHITIRGNLFRARGAGQRPVFATNGQAASHGLDIGAAEGLFIIDNQMISYDSNNYFCGMLVSGGDGGWTDVHIRGNKIVAAPGETGAVLKGAIELTSIGSTKLTNAIVSDNTITWATMALGAAGSGDSGRSGIYLSNGCETLQIEGNTITGFSYGITCDVTLPTGTKIRHWHDNKFVNIATNDGDINVGANLMDQQRVLMIDGFTFKNLNFGPIEAGATLKFTSGIIFTNVSGGEVAVLGVPASLDDGIVVSQPRVNINGSITWYLTNTTGVTITPNITNTWHVRVINPKPLFN